MIKSIFCLLIIAHCVLADFFSQLQFIKIVSPTNGQSLQVGEKAKIKYVMQPLVLNSTSNGYALSLKINLHKRAGNKKQQQILVVDAKCPVAANKNSYKTYEKDWVIPTDLTPGSYALDFVELAQTRRRQVSTSEMVKINIVD